MPLKNPWDKIEEPFLKEAILSVLRRKTDIPIWDWMEEQGFSTEGNRFRISQTPFLKDPMEAYRNPMVITIVVTAPAQSAKTTLSEGCTSYGISEVGGNSIFYGPSDDDVKEFIETRMDKHYELLPRLNRMLHPDPSKSKRKLKIHKDRSWFSALSAFNRNKLQSRTAKRVHGDEPAQWIEGRIEESMKRTKRFDKTSAKRLFTSTPEQMFMPQKMGDEPTPTSFYEVFLSGTQKEWGITCPKCGTWSELGLSNFSWTSEVDDSTPKDDNGNWNLIDVKNNLRFICSNHDCGQSWKDTPKTRSLFGEIGSYKASNPDVANLGERYCESYHYTAFAVPWTGWFTIIRSFLRAQELQKRGNFIPLREVVRKELGEFWRDQDHAASTLLVTGGYSGEMDGDNRYWIADQWEDRGQSAQGIPFCFVSVDVQKDHFWVCCREWSSNGNSRLRLFGRVDTWQDIIEIEKMLEIPSSSVLVDSGWRRYGANQREHEVYRVCFQNGWIALKGDDRQSYPWPSKKKGEKNYRPFSMPDWRDGGQGTKSQGKRRSRRKFFMMFSNPTLKDHLHILKTGSSECSFGIGSNVPKDYLEQMEGEAKSPDTGRWEKVGENHAWDCETQGLIPAYMFGLFG